MMFFSFYFLTAFKYSLKQTLIKDWNALARASWPKLQIEYSINNDNSQHHLSFSLV